MNRLFPSLLLLVLLLTLSSPLRAEPLAGVPIGVSGNIHFDEAQIRGVLADQLAEIATSGLSPAVADDAAFFLTLFYQKAGYSQAHVRWALPPGGGLRLTIEEGPLARLGAIGFSGNDTVPSATLLEFVLGKPEDRPRDYAFPFVESDIQSAVSRIRGYYLQEGFLDSIVDDPEITLSPDKTRADIRIYIYEGTRYRYGDLIFDGDLLFSREEILKELEPFLSKPYTPAGVINMERNIAYFYRSKGYFKVKVTSEGNPEAAIDGAVPVRFVIQSGGFYRFDGITQEGLGRLRPSFLEGRFKRLAGEPYNPARVERRHRALMATGLFSDLRIHQKAIPGNLVQLQIKVREAKARELGFVAGYGTLEGAILGARFLDRNPFGFGRPFSANAEIAQNLLRGEVLYSDPWLFDSRYTLRLRLYALSQSFKDYDKLEAGLRVELARKFGRHLEISGFALARGLNINNSGQIDPAELGKTNYVANSLGASFTLDYRDSVLNPTRGWVVTGSADLGSSAFGSSINYLRTTGRVSWYHPIGPTLLAVGLRGGIITPLSGDDLPIDERFFTGGSRSVRSYVERSMGPKDRHGKSVGGETLLIFNIENVFPIYENLKGAVFFDAGSVGRHVGDGVGVTGYAVGLGLRYALPIGPVRIDYGFNPVPGKGKPTGAWNFSLGVAF